MGRKKKEPEQVPNSPFKKETRGRKTVLKNPEPRPFGSPPLKQRKHKDGFEYLYKNGTPEHQTEIRAKVTLLIEMGIAVRSIANYFGTNEETIKEMFEDIFKTARLDTFLGVTSTLYQKCMGGDMKAIQLWVTIHGRYFGWTQTDLGATDDPDRQKALEAVRAVAEELMKKNESEY